MENLHLAPDDPMDEDDLYSGYDYNSIANVSKWFIIRYNSKLHNSVIVRVWV